MAKIEVGKVNWVSKCSVCNHAQSDIIDHHILTRDITMPQIAAIFSIPRSTLNRHMKNCLGSRREKAKEVLAGAAATRLAASTLGRTDEVFEAAKPLLEKVVEAQDVDGAAKIIESLHANIRLRGEITREIQPPGQGGMASGSPGGGVQVIMMPTLAGKSPAEIAQMVSAPTLNLEAIHARELLEAQEEETQ